MQNRKASSLRYLVAALSVTGSMGAITTPLLAGAKRASAHPYPSLKGTIQEQVDAPKETITPDTPANRALFDAFTKNDMAAIKAALDKGANPNATATSFLVNIDREGTIKGYVAQPAEPFLKRAITWRQGEKTLSMFRLFLERGLDVNAKSSDGTTPLFWAIDLEDAALVRAVAERGADVNAPYPAALGGGNALTPLMNSINPVNENEKMPLLHFLLDKGADTNFYTPYGWTPLLGATFFGDRQTLAALLAHGANPNATLRAPVNGEKPLFPPGHSAIQLAARYAHPGILPLLIKATPNLSPVDAAAAGLADALRRALDSHTVSPDAVDDEGTPLLTLAARSGDAETVTLLLERGAKIETRTRAKGTSALYEAVAAEQVETVRVLLEHHADPNALSTPEKDSGKTSQTPLSKAVYIPSPPIVELLLKHGALVHGPGNDNDALVQAIYYAGGQPVFREGRNPQARLRGDDLLEGQGNVFDLVLTHSDVPRHGGSALAAAVNRGQWELAQLLLAKKADVNAREQGKTVLMLTLTKMGLNRGGLKVLGITKEKLDALRLEVVAEDKEAMAFLRALLRRHPDLDTRASGTTMDTEEGLTALGFARHYLLSDVESLLRRAGARQ